MVEKLSVKKVYEGKNILLTGTTGFMGRMFLSLILYHFSDINKIYVLVRNNDSHKSHHRISEILEHSEVFSPVRNLHKDQYLQFINEKVEVIEGDLMHEQLGLETQVYNHIANEVDLIIHNASLTTFSAPIDIQLKTNIYGTRELVQLAKMHQKAKILYVSSCYAVGNQSGLMKEEQITNRSPNNQSFDVNIVVDEIQKRIDIVKTHHGQSHEECKRDLIQIGDEMANQYGWPNSYVFTKGLAEALLYSERNHINYAIVRPSIVESSLFYPFEGWNHGFNASAPFIFMGDYLYPPYIVKGDLCLDIVPVDLACSSILFVGAMLINGNHEMIYQIASSQLNKNELEDIVNYIVDYKSVKLKKNKKMRFYRNFYSNIKRKIIQPNHFLSPITFHNMLVGVLKKLSFFENLHGLGLVFSTLTKPIKKLERKFKKLSKLYGSFLPYTYYNDCIFETKNIKKVQSEESEFLFNIENIDWKEYWLKIHIPGVEKWCHLPERSKHQADPKNIKK